MSVIQKVERLKKDFNHKRPELSSYAKLTQTSLSNLDNFGGSRQKVSRDISKETFLDSKYTGDSNSRFNNYNSTKKKLLEMQRKEKLEKMKARKIIFFVVHGLEANPFDMRHIRAAILANIPNSSVHLVQKNYNLTNECISKQGRRFAEEVKELNKLREVQGRLTRKHRIRVRGALAGGTHHPRGSQASPRTQRQNAVVAEPELAPLGLCVLEVPRENRCGNQE